MNTWCRTSRQFVSGISKKFHLQQKRNAAKDQWIPMTDHSLEKPQLKFKDKIDNSNAPFKPRIRYKPNAKLSLDDSMALPSDITPEMTRSSDFVYPHPYEFELECFQLDDKFLNRSEPIAPKPIQDTDCTLVSDVNELNKMFDVLLREDEIAIDLEHHDLRSFQGFTCLMQISTRTEDFIVDTLALRSELHILNEVFTNPKIIKVFHQCGQDILWLQRDLGLYIVNLFDTGQASEFQRMQQPSLAYLIKQYCNILIDKKHQYADWRVRPLSAEMVEYARLDSHYLLYLYDRLRNELIERDERSNYYLLKMIDKCTKKCAQVYKKPIYTDDLYLKLLPKSKTKLNSQQIDALKHLYSWREKIARSKDESRVYVLPDPVVLKISERLPETKDDLFTCWTKRTYISPLVEQNTEEILNIIRHARNIK